MDHILADFHRAWIYGILGRKKEQDQNIVGRVGGNVDWRVLDYTLGISAVVYT
jgi:hypothetical protein